MDFFDKLLPVIFLIIWTLLAVQGRKKRPRSRPAPKPAGRRDIEHTQDEQTGATRTTGTPKRGQQPPARGFFESLKEGVEQLSREIVESVQTVPAPAVPGPKKGGGGGRAASVPLPPAAHAGQNFRDGAEAQDDEISQRGKRSTPALPPRRAAGTHARPVKRWPLTQAVIWSEIIGPPVSLRPPTFYD